MRVPGGMIHQWRTRGGDTTLVLGIEHVHGCGFGAGDRLRKARQRGQNRVADAVEQAELRDRLQPSRLGIGERGHRLVLVNVGVH